MAGQYKSASVGFEFKPTLKGIAEVHIDDKFRYNPDYKKRVPKRWLAKGWIRECRIAKIK